MHNDDAMVGRLLTRRELVALLGLSGIAAIADPVSGQAPAAAPLPACVVQPEQTEGPYFVDKMLNRSDIRPDPVSGAVKPGAPLRVAFNVSRVAANGTCTPIAGAQVDLWQCDAAGVYSGVQDPRFDTTGQHFLRGHQVTDARGTANFLTIYPGWYQGRAVHLHFKIRTTPTAQRGYEFTSQLYFDEALNDRVFAGEPYSARTGQRTRNERDRIFANGGTQLMLPVTAAANGYAGSFSVGLHADPGSSAGAGRNGR
jgi:protocatechuate 3,4-dioxygenase beta subunit